jgi:hypothetical protein
MSPANRRVVEVVIGLALLGYTVYEIRRGEYRGKWRIYNRHEDPWSFWSGIVLQFGISFLFLIGVH